MAGILDQINAFLSPERQQAREKSFNTLGGLVEPDALKQMASYYLGPYAGELKNAGKIAQMVDPAQSAGRASGATDRAISSAESGNYGEAMSNAGQAMMEVGGVLIPTAVVWKFGAQTAYMAAKGLQETLTLTGNAMGSLGVDAYSKFISNMSQRGPAPTMYSNPIDAMMPTAKASNSGKTATLPNGTTVKRSGVPPTNTKSKFIQMPDGSRIPRPKTMTEVPDIRNMSVEDALFIARQEPHIIAGGESSRGAYIGGPENIKNRRNLTAQRASMDEQIAAGADGGDWYDRFRASIDNVTSNPKDATWMAKQEGMYSAGVSPEGELSYALKDNNSAIATGADPATMVKAARPAQKEASIKAVKGNDPLLHQLGEKTGEYANKIDPRAAFLVKTATGVNDFRHARTLGFTEPGGAPQREGLGGPNHTYSDYETALSVDRANKTNLSGRSNWTGEQVQAAPWVKQKGDDFYERYKKSYDKKATEQLKAIGQPFSVFDVERVGRQISFDDASRTIGDFFPKHTAFETMEAQPYIGIDGHLPGLAKASQAERESFAAMPGSGWAGPDGRDSLYAGLRAGDTGAAMRVLPTTKMQGVYTPPAGVTEYNPGEVARPLVGFDNSGPTKKLPIDDRRLMDAAGNVRAVVDAQGAAAYHKPFAKGNNAFSNDVFAGLPTERPLSEDELGLLGKIGAKYNLGDVIDTGQGATLTNFDDAVSLADEINYGAADEAYLKKNNQVVNKKGELRLTNKQLKSLSEDLDNIGFSTLDRVDVDSGYIGYEGAWGAGKGSGEVTKQLLDFFDSMPAGLVKAFNQNDAIPQKALARMMRDQSLARQYGGTRSDIQRLRSIIAGTDSKYQAKGWIDRVRKAVKDGAILPGLGAFALSQSLDQGASDALPES